MKNKTEGEKEYLPLLKYVMILNDKGVPVTVDSACNMMNIGALDVKREDGEWYVAKHEMLQRLKARGKKWPAVEAGYFSVHGLIYRLSEHGVVMHEENVYRQVTYGLMEYKIDSYGRYIIPAHELDKKVERFGPKN